MDTGARGQGRASTYGGPGRRQKTGRDAGCSALPLLCGSEAVTTPVLVAESQGAASTLAAGRKKDSSSTPPRKAKRRKSRISNALGDVLCACEAGIERAGVEVVAAGRHAGLPGLGF